MNEKRREADRRAAIATTNTVGQIGCMTSLASGVIIGIAFCIGRFLDQTFGTHPWLLLVLLFASFPVTLFAIVRLSLSMMERARKSREKIVREIETDEESNYP